MNDVLTAANLLALAPILALSGGAVLLMLQISVQRHFGWACGITLASFLAAGIGAVLAMNSPDLQLTPLLLADDYALFFSALFCFCGGITTLISRDYLATRRGQNEEFFLLLLLSTLGAVTLAYATHLASLLLGLELLGVALYALIAYPDRGTLPLEAAIKYLILSGAASAVFLFGFALIYASLGSLSYDAIGPLIRASAGGSTILLTAGAAMIMAGLGFKLSVVPFHMWTPDVYEGAPAPISGFLAAVSKGAVFAALLRWWLASNLYEFNSLLTAFAVLAGASMLVGNLLALLQENIKRLLAYSSIAHMGYLLIVLVACGLSPSPSLAIEATCYYLVAYAITTMGAFSVLGLISKSSGDTERDQLEDLSGLFWRQPALALLFSIALMSLAGIPLTAGFIGKFYLFTTGVNAALWGLLALLVVGSAISIFYYLRIIYTMSRTPAEDADKTGTEVSLSYGSQFACYLLIFLMLYLGTAPDTLMGYLRTIL
jgi:NADH-quinone oxidoreductase subunit N